MMLVASLLMAMVLATINAQGGTSYCRFPFIYNNNLHSDCIRENDPKGELWCSTKIDNLNNHIKGNWRHCTGDYRGPSYCRFPFIYNNIRYSACTTKDDPDKKLWCSTKTDNFNNHIKTNFRHCENTDPTVPKEKPAEIPSEDECGKSVSDNVVNGELTEQGDWPWLAALGKRRGATFTPFCGGTLITKQHVISAAHCFKTERTQTTIVRLGEYNWQKGNDGAQPQDFNIVDERMGEYNNETKENDIILLKLNSPVTSFTDDIRAACLPYHLRNDNFEGKTLTVVGWGIFNNRIDRIAPIPLRGDVSVVPVGECLKRFNNLYKIDNKQLCAGTGGTDSCRGDSGGPLNFLDTTTARFYVVGLVSFGPKSCGSQRQPGVYARIGNYLDWIEENMKQMK